MAKDLGQGGTVQLHQRFGAKPVTFGDDLVIFVRQRAGRTGTAMPAKNHGLAVFHAFGRVVSEGRSAFVVLDTAPTSHSLLLMDATGAYHRQIMREFEGQAGSRFVTPLMRLQDPGYTKIILVTLPETTPVSQTGALQKALRRAKIETFAWVINKSVLAARLQGEQAQLDRVNAGFSKRTFLVPWRACAPIGLSELAALVTRPKA